MSAEKLSQQLEQIVLKRISEDTLSLPLIPALATRLAELLRETDGVPKQSIQLFEHDALLAARAVRLAGPTASSNGKVTLGEVLNRMGAKTLRSLLADTAGQKLTLSRDPKIAEAIRKLWEHSVAVGTLARDVLALSGHADSEAAYLAGLLHDLGKPVVASLLLEVERQIVDLYNRPFIEVSEWLDVVTRIHRKVGIAIVEKWQLPEQMARCVRDCTEYDNADRNSLVNAVCFSNALAKKVGVYAGPIDAEDVDALVMIGRSLIGISDDVLKTLSKGLKERVSGLFT
jgi:putative nucleotidyltransferase with HDIG domain